MIRSLSNKKYSQVLGLADSGRDLQKVYKILSITHRG